MHDALTLMESNQLHATQSRPKTTALSVHLLNQFAQDAGCEAWVVEAMKSRENQEETNLRTFYAGKK